MSKYKRRWCLAPLFAVLCAGCDFPGRPNRADLPVPANQVVDFDVLYRTHCAGCHGADGRLGPAPPLNDPLFLAIVSDAELLRVIHDGRVVTPAQKSPMPAFARASGGPLTEAQVTALAEGIKKRWASAPSGGAPSQQLSLDVGNGGNRDEGALVFARSCAGCHGKQGEGMEQNGRLRRKLNDPAFLALISDKELRRIVITGRPDVAMPPYDGKDGRPPDFQPLTSEQIDDLVALLASWRQSAPTGGE